MVKNREGEPVAKSPAALGIEREHRPVWMQNIDKGNPAKCRSSTISILNQHMLVGMA
jgi:hypothetical protein